jgi:hypothetical protein
MLNEHAKNTVAILQQYHNAVGDAIEIIRLLNAENIMLKQEVGRHLDVINDLLRDKYGSHH